MTHEGRVGEDAEIRLPWGPSDYRNEILRRVNSLAPRVIDELVALADIGDIDTVRHGVEGCARRWHLDKPWIVKTMRRTLRFWQKAPAMRAARQWAPVLPENGWGHRRSWRRRKVPQYRGFRPRPTSNIQDAEVFGWWVQYHVLHESYATIADDVREVKVTAVRMAVSRLARELELPLRKGRRGRPRTRQIAR